MIGAADIANCMSENGDFDDLAGITPRAVSELFRLLNERTAQIDFVVSFSLFVSDSDAFAKALIFTALCKKIVFQAIFYSPRLSFNSQNSQ